MEITTAQAIPVKKWKDKMWHMFTFIIFIYLFYVYM